MRSVSIHKHGHIQKSNSQEGIVSTSQHLWIDRKTNDISTGLQQGTPHINIKKYVVTRKINNKERKESNIRKHTKPLTPTQGV
jgi:hypothetical protein